MVEGGEGEIEEVVGYLEVGVAFIAGLKEVKPQIQYHPKKGSMKNIILKRWWM